MSDIAHLYESPRRRCRRDLVDPNMLCLAFRLSDLDETWAKFIPFRYIENFLASRYHKRLCFFKGRHCQELPVVYHLHGQTGPRFDSTDTKFRTGKFPAENAFTICTNQSVPFTEKTARKA